MTVTLYMYRCNYSCVFISLAQATHLARVNLNTEVKQTILQPFHLFSACMSDNFQKFLCFTARFLSHLVGQ